MLLGVVGYAVRTRHLPAEWVRTAHPTAHWLGAEA